MKKEFNVNGIVYTVEEVTAIAASAGEYAEDARQSALLVTNEADSGEKAEYVVFGFDMPENEDDFAYMSENSDAWDSDAETLESVQR